MTTMWRASLLGWVIWNLGSPLIAAERPNVLFIAIDDQNDWIGTLGGHPLAQTPHLDALATRGTVFLNAHCQAPLSQKKPSTSRT